MHGGVVAVLISETSPKRNMAGVEPAMSSSSL